MDAGGSPDVSVKKSKITPKAVIHQKFGRTAIYRVEEVQDTADNVCLGLAITQKGPSYYRCTLELPELCVTSELCKRKKDAEQSAAEKAMEKLNIHLEGHSGNDEHDPWSSMVTRINHFLSDEFLSTFHPVSCHFRASCHGGRDPNGAIPISILPAYDTRINNICKLVCSEVELNPFLAVFIVMKAVAKLFGSLSSMENQFWLQRCTTFPSSENNKPRTQENIHVGAIYIPDSLEKSVELLSIFISSNEYYLDSIARNLGVSDAYKVTMSRPVKASSELRFYYVIPTWWQYDSSSDFIDAVKAVPSDAPLNMRASYLSGQCIYGNSILACIGYVWHLTDLQHETISLHTYYRLLLGKMPSGIYKLSRDSLLASELPNMYTTRSNWKGCSPRQILSSFCTRHRLPEPIFTVHRISSSGTSTDEPQSVNKRLKLEDAGEEEETASIQSDFRCDIKVLSRNGGAVITYSRDEIHRKEDAAIQRAALDVVTWMNGFLMEPDMSLEELRDAGRPRGIDLYVGPFMDDFCLSLLARGMKSQMSFFTENEVEGSPSFQVEGAAATAAVPPANGFVVTVDYAVSVVADGGGGGDVVEKKHGFQFEMGTGSVLPFVESAVSRLCAGQSCFFRRGPPRSTGLLHAAAPPDVPVSP